MTLEEFVKDDANLAKFEACETQEDVNALLAAEGIDINDVQENGELSEDDLENVAGGVSWLAIWTVTTFVICHWDEIKKVAKDIGQAFSRGGKYLVDWYNKNKSKFNRAGIR